MRFPVISTRPGPDGVIVMVGDETTLIEFTLTPESPWYEQVAALDQGDSLIVVLGDE